MKQTIILILTGHCWAVDWANTDRAGVMRKVFETTLVPLPFTADAAPEAVHASVQAMFPRYIIQRRSQTHQPATGGVQ